MHWTTEHVEACEAHQAVTDARIGRATSVEDLISFIEDTPRAEGASCSSEKPFAHTSNGDSKDWDIVEARAACTGAYSWTMVAFYIDLARKGYARAREDLREMMIEVEAGANNAPRPDFTFDVAGSIPSVPAYIAGDPACMMDLGTTPNKPSCRVSVEVAYAWFVSDRAVYMRGVAILGLLQSLERQGIHVELSIALTSIGAGRNFAIICPIREMGEAFDLDKIAFFLCCPGALRRLGFAVLERDKETAPATHNGYGEGQSLGLQLGEFDLVVPRLSSGLSGNRAQAKQWEDAEYAHKTIAEIAQAGGYAQRPHH
jgi:hypothetical protein